jgi:hypothetical protein
VQHLPHWFQVATAGATLVMELGLVFMLFFPRRVRIICFFIVTPWEIGVILTANYAFLNYLVLALGILLLDDRSLLWLIPRRWRPPGQAPPPEPEFKKEAPISILAVPEPNPAPPDRALEAGRARAALPARLAHHLRAISLAVSALLLAWIAYDTTAELIAMPFGRIASFFAWPIQALDPLRIANQYGLFAVMTRGRYEIEFQGSNDGTNWTPYPFQFKPQALNRAPGVYAPYQPRFDWNLWFASLGDWQQNQIVPLTEEHLLVGDPAVLSLFKNNPFPQSPPRYVRAVLWQYWFTTMAQKRRTGDWWRRKFIGLYAPELTIVPDGRFAVVEWPPQLPPHD